MQPVFTGRIPSSFELLTTLIELLADQEGLTITYKITDGDTTVRKSTDRKVNEKWEKAS